MREAWLLATVIVLIPVVVLVAGVFLSETVFGLPMFLLGIVGLVTAEFWGLAVLRWLGLDD